MNLRSFEDFPAGAEFDLGSHRMTKQEIVEFAGEYDPQPFHDDVEAAKESSFGGLIASGWHTCSMFMRLMVDGMISGSSSQGSPGMEELRWLAPVRPGDRLTGTVTIREAWASATKPDRGTILVENAMTNQDGVVVMWMVGRGMYGRRPS